MNNKVKERLIKYCQRYIDKPNSKYRHFTFIIKGNKIISTGWCDAQKTHPAAQKYRSKCIHSELSALIRFKGKPEDLASCLLVNIRLNKQLNIRYSKPCCVCQGWIKDMPFKEIWYTDSKGNFLELKL